MTSHCRERLKAGKPGPGVFILSQSPAYTGEIIDWLLLIWSVSEPDEWRNRIVFLPIQ